MTGVSVSLSITCNRERIGCCSSQQSGVSELKCDSRPMTISESVVGDGGCQPASESPGFHTAQAEPLAERSVPEIPNSDNSNLHPCFVWVNTLFTEPLLKLLTLPEETGIRQEFVYLESLHGTFITCATGLRAPPSVLA